VALLELVEQDFNLVAFLVEIRSIHFYQVSQTLTRRKTIGSMIGKILKEDLMKNATLSILVTSVLLTTPAFADWTTEESTPGELSAAGALSVGAGVLYTLATPVIVTSELSTHSNPVGVSLIDSAAGVSMTGTGIVLLLEGTGKGLSELTADTLQATDTLAKLTTETVAAGIPRVTIEFPDQCGKPVKKSIPLVVRKDYVEMYEKVETKP
jgi:hypothetical protein